MMRLQKEVYCVYIQYRYVIYKTSVYVYMIDANPCVMFYVVMQPLLTDHI